MAEHIESFDDLFYSFLNCFHIPILSIADAEI